MGRGREDHKQRNEAILAAYLSGERQADIVARFGLSPPRISAIISSTAKPNCRALKARRAAITRPQSKPERNAEIVRLYLAGATSDQLAEQFDLSTSRIRFILQRDGGEKFAREYRRRNAELLRARATDPATREKLRHLTTKRWQEGERLGRRMMFADDPVKREDYVALRRVYGAAYAREAMGL